MPTKNPQPRVNQSEDRPHGRDTDQPKRPSTSNQTVASRQQQMTPSNSAVISSNKAVSKTTGTTPVTMNPSHNDITTVNTKSTCDLSAISSTINGNTSNQPQSLHPNVTTRTTEEEIMFPSAINWIVRPTLELSPSLLDISTIRHMEELIGDNENDNYSDETPDEPDPSRWDPSNEWAPKRNHGKRPRKLFRKQGRDIATQKMTSLIEKVPTYVGLNHVMPILRQLKNSSLGNNVCHEDCTCGRGECVLHSALVLLKERETERRRRRVANGDEEEDDESDIEGNDSRQGGNVYLNARGDMCDSTRHGGVSRVKESVEVGVNTDVYTLAPHTLHDHMSPDTVHTLHPMQLRMLTDAALTVNKVHQYSHASTQHTHTPTPTTVSDVDAEVAALERRGRKGGDGDALMNHINDIISTDTTHTHTDSRVCVVEPDLDVLGWLARRVRVAEAKALALEKAFEWHSEVGWNQDKTACSEDGHSHTVMVNAIQHVLHTTMQQQRLTPDQSQLAVKVQQLRMALTLCGGEHLNVEMVDEPQPQHPPALLQMSEPTVAQMLIPSSVSVGVGVLVRVCMQSHALPLALTQSLTHTLSALSLPALTALTAVRLHSEEYWRWLARFVHTRHHTHTQVGGVEVVFDGDHDLHTYDDSDSDCEQDETTPVQKKMMKTVLGVLRYDLRHYLHTLRKHQHGVSVSSGADAVEPTDILPTSPLARRLLKMMGVDMCTHSAATATVPPDTHSTLQQVTHTTTTHTTTTSSSSYTNINANSNTPVSVSVPTNSNAHTNDSVCLDQSVGAMNTSMNMNTSVGVGMGVDQSLVMADDTSNPINTTTTAIATTVAPAPVSTSSVPGVDSGDESDVLFHLPVPMRQPLGYRVHDTSRLDISNHSRHTTHTHTQPPPHHNVDHHRSDSSVGVSAGELEVALRRHLSLVHASLNQLHTRIHTHSGEQVGVGTAVGVTDEHDYPAVRTNTARVHMLSTRHGMDLMSDLERYSETQRRAQEERKTKMKDKKQQRQQQQHDSEEVESLVPRKKQKGNSSASGPQPDTSVGSDNHVSRVVGLSDQVKMTLKDKFRQHKLQQQQQQQQQQLEQLEQQQQQQQQPSLPKKTVSKNAMYEEEEEAVPVHSNEQAQPNTDTPAIPVDVNVDMSVDIDMDAGMDLDELMELQRPSRPPFHKTKFHDTSDSDSDTESSRDDHRVLQNKPSDRDQVKTEAFSQQAVDDEMDVDLNTQESTTTSSAVSVSMVSSPTVTATTHTHTTTSTDPVHHSSSSSSSSSSESESSEDEGVDMLDDPRDSDIMLETLPSPSLSLSLSMSQSQHMSIPPLTMLTQPRGDVIDLDTHLKDEDESSSSSDGEDLSTQRTHSSQTNTTTVVKRSLDSDSGSDSSSDSDSGPSKTSIGTDDVSVMPHSDSDQDAHVDNLVSATIDETIIGPQFTQNQSSSDSSSSSSNESSSQEEKPVLKEEVSTQQLKSRRLSESSDSDSDSDAPRSTVTAAKQTHRPPSPPPSAPSYSAPPVAVSTSSSDSDVPSSQPLSQAAKPSATNKARIKDMFKTNNNNASKFKQSASRFLPGSQSQTVSASQRPYTISSDSD